MNDGFLSLLGIARRAGKLSLGFDAVAKSAAKGKAELVLTTSDCAKNTAERLERRLGEHVDKISVPYDMDRLGHAVGKAVKVLSINDAGFAKKARTLLNTGNGEVNTYGN